jgi:fused signal recognition particle receptor
MAGFLSRLREGLSRTAAGIRERLGADVPASPANETPQPAATTPGAPAGGPRVESLDALEDALLTADVGLAATERIIGAVRADRQGTLLERVRRVILQMLSEVAPAPAMSGRPHVILVVGVNGTGKTTSVGKLAHYYTAQGQTVVIAAADTFRAAAIDQIAVWADRAGVELVRARPGTDPAAIAFDAVAAARARGRDVVLVDTAGRLHTRTNLMAELDKIRRVVGREVPGAPQEVLLVLDATVGQNGLVQAREFMAASGANGIVLTKLDGTAKGGVAITIAHELKLPIRFVGVGEGLDDLLPFDPSAYVDAIFTEKW